MYPADRTPRAELVPALSQAELGCAGPASVLAPGEPNDLATDPGIPGTVSVAPQSGKFPAAILCVIGQQLSNGVARKVAAQSDSLHLVLDTT
jgi:hypothetical protein